MADERRVSHVNAPYEVTVPNPKRVSQSSVLVEKSQGRTDRFSTLYAQVEITPPTSRQVSNYYIMVEVTDG